MSQSAPGWYQDHDDPRLARWWDGDRWTEHTLVLDEQDWSTEPDPPTRFPGSGEDTALVETAPPAYEEDIYAPIRDPWGNEDPAPATTVWEGAAAGATVVGAESAWGGTPASAAWSEDPYEERGSSSRFVDGLPTWAKVGLPLAVLLVAVIAFAALSGGDDDPDVNTLPSSTTSTSRANLGDAADAALTRAGTGPFTRSTFTTLIQLACSAAETNDPTALTQRIVQLGYDTDTLAKLMDGLDVGTEAYCPEDMAGAPTLLAAVESAATAGASSSTTGVTVGGSSTTITTKKPNTTTTTKKPGTTTTSTTAPTTTSTTAPTTTTTQPPSTTTSTTSCVPQCEG